MTMSRGPVVVAMSGGVDSAVAAALLVAQGREVIGVSLRLHGAVASGAPGRCCSAEDFRDARLVAGRLGIPYFVFDAEREFEAGVLDRFRSEYRSGRTPSPCVACNSDVKFGALLDRARTLGAGSVATGHYARLRDNADGTRSLLAAADRTKDQSYFLFDLDQEQLSAAEFPVGDLSKTEVRRIAREQGLPVSEKPESQDICFVPEGSYRAVLEQDEAGLGRAGEIVTRTGETLGRHEGVAGFTVGQRRGLGISAPSALYVLQVDAAEGRVVVGPEDDLLAEGLRASRWRWTNGREPQAPVRGSLRIRYRHPAAGALVTPAEPHAVRAFFDTPQRAVAPGQAAVLYDGDAVIGGGWIDGPLSAAAA